MNSARLAASEYYAPLLDHADDILRVGAWSVLLEREHVTQGQYAEVVALSRHGAIRSRAFRFFEANWDHEFAQTVAEISASTETEAETLAMQAELACDPEAGIEAERLRFLATGRFDALQKMLKLADELDGWRRALPVAVRNLVLFPHDAAAAADLLDLLYTSRQAEDLAAAISILDKVNLHGPVTLLYSAGLSLLKGNPGEALRRLQKLATVRSDVLARTMRRHMAMRLTAEALEKLGNYEKAFAGYLELKRSDHAAPPNLTSYYAILKAGADLAVPPLPPDARHNHFMMTGFARSGTTLLENTLAANPAIETFEETPAGTSMQYHLDRMLPAARSDAERIEVFLAARERYYVELDRRHRKDTATVFIDKMPMRSGEAKLLVKLMPDKRYLFSIRHPFDVVLSCIKQYFSRNIAMDHFRSFDTAVKLYDFTMEQWFTTFGLDDPRVHYIRYEKLVTEFEPTVRATLKFVGAPWDEQVLDFAEAAERRQARTPSYQKVRQGLGIGVQTQWRNYGFLFQKAEAKPLYKWADFFGYETA